MKRRLSWHFYVVCTVVVVAAAVFFWHFRRMEEYAYELADLEVMRNAEDMARLLWYGKLPDAPVEYWFSPGELSLRPITEPIPRHCGMGTKMTGGAVKDFKEKTGKTYNYSEHDDYRDKALLVTVDNSNGTLDIRVDWVIRKYQYVQYANLFDELDPAWFAVD